MKGGCFFFSFLDGRGRAGGKDLLPSHGVDAAALAEGDVAVVAGAGSGGADLDFGAWELAGGGCVDAGFDGCWRGKEKQCQFFSSLF